MAAVETAFSEISSRERGELEVPATAADELEGGAKNGKMVDKAAAECKEAEVPAGCGGELEPEPLPHWGSVASVTVCCSSINDVAGKHT